MESKEKDNYKNYDYIRIITNDDGSIALCFDIENDKILEIGDEMNEMLEDAYMNGYNWDAFLNCYLAKEAPEILEEMDTDPEAGSYVAYYKGNPENEARAKRFADLIISLVEDKERLFKFLREKGEDIEWD